MAADWLASVGAIGSQVASLIGPIGGTIGIATGLSSYFRRRQRLKVSLTYNSDEFHEWLTLTIANSSDLALTYKDTAIGWFILTPFGYKQLNWAYQPEDEVKPVTIAPHGVATLTFSDDDWNVAVPKKYRSNAVPRLYLFIPATGRGIWLKVLRTRWPDDSWRERLINYLYGLDASE